MPLAIKLHTIPLKADPDGVMRVGETRVTLDTVIHAFEQGHTAEEIISHYPVLRLADVYSIIAYYLNNQVAVEAYLRQQQEATQKTWEQIEAQPDYQGFRQRLIARHQAKMNPSDQ